MTRRTLALAQQPGARAAEAQRAGVGRPAEKAGPLWSSLALRIEPANSPQERQAESVASQVVQRKCDECEEEDAKRKVQRDVDGGDHVGVADSAGAAVSSVLDSGAGQPLDTTTRDYFEPRFSQDFDDVRVHTGAAASASARAIHARAYTSGSDIVFRDGEFSPGTAGGRHLLAHELTHVVQQRSNEDGVIARQADAGVDDAAVAGPSPQPAPTPSLTTGLDATFVDDPNAPPPGPDAIVMAGLPLSSDPAFVRYQLNKFIEGHDRIDKGVDQARFVIERLASEISTARGDLSSMSGVTAESERLSEWIPRAERALPVVQQAFAEIEKGHGDFLREFQARAEITTASLLDMSLERINSELARYGLGTTSHTTTRWRKEADGPMTKEDNVTVTHHMAQNNATTGMATAAKALADRLRIVKQLVVQRNSLYVLKTPPGIHDPKEKVWAISDPQKYEELAKQISTARGEYEVLRNDKERDYPILAAYTAYDSGLGTAFLESTISGLDALGKGPSSAVAETLNTQIDEKRRNIQTTWHNLETGDLDIFKLPPVIAATESVMNIQPGSVQHRLVQEKVDRIQSKELIISIALSVLALALGLIAAIPSGGSSLVAAGTFIAGAGAATVSGYFAYEHLNQYMLESAASGTDFDKARAISNADPSLFWLAVDIVSAGLDIYAAASAFKALSVTVREALDARRAAKAAVEAEQLEKLVAKAEELAPGKGLGEKIREGILHQQGHAGTSADRAFAQWESTINQESRAFLVDNPGVMAHYSEMSEGTRRVLTFCASMCLIPTATKKQVKQIDALLAKLGEGDTTNLQKYLHAYADDLDTALANLQKAKVKNWDDIDEVLRLETFGGTGQTKALSKAEIEDAIDEMFSPYVTGGQEARIEGHKIPRTKRTRFDIQDLPRKAGETMRQAYKRVQNVIYKRLDQIEEVERAWEKARKYVLRERKLTADNYGELYDLTRNQFWKEVRRDPAAKKVFTDAGFIFPEGETTAPLLANTSANARKTEIRVSLDHMAEKAIGDNWKKALDADNLRMEFSMPNTYREIIQARHPELRALTE